MTSFLDSALDRRGFFALAAGASFAACGRLRAGEELFGKLIAESRSFPSLSRRIDFISAALIGKRYRANT